MSGIVLNIGSRLITRIDPGLIVSVAIISFGSPVGDTRNSRISGLGQ